jgi:hypothetical protein
MALSTTTLATCAVSRKERAHEPLERASANLLVRDAEDAQTSSLEYPVPLLVCGSLQIVHTAIDFEHESMFDTEEIDDEATDDLLAPPLEPQQPPVAEQLPGPGFGRRRGAPKPTRDERLLGRHTRPRRRRRGRRHPLSLQGEGAGG